MNDDGNDTLSLFDEQVTFIQHHLPGLDAGSYELTFEQSRNDDKGPIGDTFSQKAKFAVQGDRFRITQPGNLYAVFPPVNASGEFDTVLPHVVFSKKTFPWIRYPNQNKPTWNPPPGKDVTDQDVPTWLTILLLDSDDIEAAPPGMPIPIVPLTVGDLFPKSLNGLGFSYFPKDDSSLEYGENLTDPVDTIDIPLSLFWKLAPTLKDLNYLAHSRKVSLIPKTTMPGISDLGEPLGDFSIVFGNRLPQDGKRAYAYLVSLEGLEIYLPDADGNPQAGNPSDGTKFLRLAVLKNWSFDSFGSPAAFDTALLSLNGRDPNQESVPATLTTLQVPSDGVDPEVQGPLQMGYVPLNHRLRTGEKTVSWYRGPLAPYQIPNQRISIPISSPDKATFFDPSTGMFDVSYAAGWTLGRQLALQDQGFSTGLYKWKNGLDLKLINQVESAMIAETFENILQSGPENALNFESLEQGAIHTNLQRKTLKLLLK